MRLAAFSLRVAFAPERKAEWAARDPSHFGGAKTRASAFASALRHSRRSRFVAAANT